jgi:hypothetical protein
LLHQGDNHVRSITRLGLATFILSSLCQAQVPHVSEERVNKNGQWVHHLTNGGANSILALTTDLHCSPSGLQTYFDPLVDYGSSHPIAPGSSYDLPLAPNTKDCPGGVSAVLYADGTYEGSKDTLNSLLVRRHGLYDQLVWLDSVLQTAADQHTGTEIVADLISAREAEVTRVETNPLRWDGSVAVLEFVVHLMRVHMLLGVPDYAKRGCPQSAGCK